MSTIRIAASPMISINSGGSGGIPVLFIHSLAGNAMHWSSQLEHIRKKRQAIAIDLRGHGSSEPPKNGDYTIESLANDIDAVVNALGLQLFVLVGHSLGGTVSIEYASKHPEMVAGLFLADPSGDARKIPKELIGPFISSLQSDSYSNVIEGYWRGLLLGSNPAVQDLILRDLCNTGEETVVGIFRSSFEYDPLIPLQRYKGPKLSVITHLNDTPISLHNLLTDLPFIKVSGTGHWLQMDKPDEFNLILDEFLATVERWANGPREEVRE